MYSIYIVEDDKKIRDELSKLLQNYGYNCISTDNFDNVSGQIISASPHLVLLDINLPICDGYQICRQLRRQSNIPIIVVTSRDTDTDELLSINLGADDFITKPYNTSILLARINTLLTRVYENDKSTVQYGGLILDKNKGVVYN